MFKFNSVNVFICSGFLVYLAWSQVTNDPRAYYGKLTEIPKVGSRASINPGLETGSQVPDALSALITQTVAPILNENGLSLVDDSDVAAQKQIANARKWPAAKIAYGLFAAPFMLFTKSAEGGMDAYLSKVAYDNTTYVRYSAYVKFKDAANPKVTNLGCIVFNGTYVFKTRTLTLLNEHVETYDKVNYVLSPDRIANWPKGLSFERVIKPFEGTKVTFVNKGKVLVQAQLPAALTAK